MRAQWGKDESGFALLLVLLLVALLAVVVTQFSFTSQVDLSIANRRLENLQHEQALRAGVLEAKRILQYDKDLDASKGKSVDSLDEAWAEERTIQVGPALVSVRITDEGSRLNLNALVDDQAQVVPAQKERLERLLLSVPEPQVPRADLIEALVDWLDKAPEGQGETGRFEARPRTETFPLYTLKELLLVKGFTHAFVFGYDRPEGTRIPGLADFAGPRWGDGFFNPNTASLEVLLALSARMTAVRADTILTARAIKPFETVQEVADLFPDWTTPPDTFLADVGGILRVGSVFFRVDLVSEIGKTETTRPRRRTARAYLQRSQARIDVLSLDFL